MKNRDNLLYIGGSIVIIVLAIVFAALLIWVLQPAPAPEPTPTLYEFPTAEEAVRVTAEASPTDTVEPTATNTAQPTKTAVPSATVDIIATGQAEQVNEYLIVYDSLSKTIHDTKARFDDKFGELIEGKVSETNGEWQAEVMVLLMMYLVQVQQMADLQPPAGYEQAHDLIVIGMNQCADGWAKMFDATQVYDTDLYNQGVQLVGQCNQNWTQGETTIANLRR